MTKVKLGQEVIDTISGFTGIAVGRTEWLNGCVRIMIQPKVDKEGKMMDNAEFDEPQIAIVDKAPLPRGASDTGGPTSSKPLQKTTLRK